MNPLQTWTVVDDGFHNAFTDLIHWKDQFWLVYTSSPSHFASKRSSLVLLHSENVHGWQKAARFDGNGEDIRDPKLAVINGQLVLYALLNKHLDPKPHTTVVSLSDDGFLWTPFVQVTPQGWLLGKPKNADKRTWFTPAHRLNEQRVILLSSQDAEHWTIESSIYSSHGADETAIEFSSSGELIAATRLEMSGGLCGQSGAGTLLSWADAPFKSWSGNTISHLTRLDGPNLIQFAGQIYAVGRYQPEICTPFHKQGSIFSKKRTALFHVSKQGLTHLTNLDSCGDTSYAGIALHEDKIFISYYTNDQLKDYPWLLGMFLPTRIVITELDLACLPKTQLKSEDRQ